MREARIDPAARSAISRSLMPIARTASYGEKARTEKERVVRAEGDRGTGACELRYGHIADIAIHAEGNVRRRAHFEGNVALHECVEQSRILDRAHAVAEAGGPQRLDDLVDVRRRGPRCGQF